MCYNCVMSEDSKTPEPTQPAAAVITEAEKPVVLNVAEEVKEEIEDGLLIEEDGDPFWVIQQVFWGIIKTALLLGLLLFLIWLVWRPGAFLGGDDEVDFVVEPSTPVEELTKVDSGSESPGFWRQVFGLGEKIDSESSDNNAEALPEKVEETPVAPKTNTTVAVEDETGTQVAYDLEADRTLLVRGILPEAIKWLREAKTVGEISMNMVREGSPSVRSRQVEEILAAADELFVRSFNLQSQLQSEKTYFLEQGNAANAETEALELEIATILQLLDPVRIEPLVAQKIVSQQNASYYMSNAKIRDTLLRNIQTFDRALRQQSIPLLNPATEIRAN